MKPVLINGLAFGLDELFHWVSVMTVFEYSSNKNKILEKVKILYFNLLLFLLIYKAEHNVLIYESILLVLYLVDGKTIFVLVL